MCVFVFVCLRVCNLVCVLACLHAICLFECLCSHDGAFVCLLMSVACVVCVG